MTESQVRLYSLLHGQTFISTTNFSGGEILNETFVRHLFLKCCNFPFQKPIRTLRSTMITLPETIESMFSFSILNLQDEHCTNLEPLLSAPIRFLQLIQTKHLLISTATILPLTSLVSLSFGFSCSSDVELSTDKATSSHTLTAEFVVPFKHFLLMKPTFRFDHTYDCCMLIMGIVSSQIVPRIAAVTSAKTMSHFLRSFCISLEYTVSFLTFAFIDTMSPLMLLSYICCTFSSLFASDEPTQGNAKFFVTRTFEQLVNLYLVWSGSYFLFCGLTLSRRTGDLHDSFSLIASRLSAEKQITRLSSSRSCILKSK